MSDVLYRKVVSKGGKVSYQEVKADEGVTVLNLTEPQCVTAAGALGVTLLTIFERNMPKMKNGSPAIIERKITDVKKAITELYRGSGQPIDESTAEWFFLAWDKTMRNLESGIEV